MLPILSTVHNYQCGLEDALKETEEINLCVEITILFLFWRKHEKGDTICF